MSDITVTVTETPELVTVNVIEGSGTSATWGGIAGLLSNQLDLQAALDLKKNKDSVTETDISLIMESQTIVVCTNTAGISVSLPDASSVIGEKRMVIQQNTGSVSVSAIGTDTINGLSSILMNNRYSVLEVLATSLGWLII